MAKSLFPEEMMNVNNTLTLESIAGKLVYFQIQIRLLHWQTTSIAEHGCLGTAYDYISGFTDEIVEKITGYTGHRPTSFKIDALSNISSMNVISDALLFAKELKKYGETNGFQDVCNLSDSFSGEMAKFKYLLTMS